MASGSRRRVGVLGAGASGMAAAWSLSRFPERYEVHVIEPGEEAGGVACSLRRSLGDGGENEVGVSINYGVQGGNSKAHQNTIEMLRLFGMDASPAELAVSFGKGEHNWKNYERKPLQTRLKGETARFGVVIKWIARLEFITIFLSIDFVLRLCLFSDAFRHRMVYPLVALFFGTGNQTPKVSAAVIARVFRDPSLALFEYDPEYLLSQAPKTIAFPELKELYSRMRQQAEATGGCTFHMRTQASRVRRTAHGVVVSLEAAPSTWRAGSDQTSGERTPATTTGEGWELALDEVIFACPANVALKILAEEASLAERWVLGSVEYFHDLTVTHTDHEYMQRHAEVDERAMYYIKTYDEKPECCEMGFHLTGWTRRRSWTSRGGLHSLTRSNISDG
ncbi:hypothetical protein AB1Y20_020289 [Prymnesium parvum]|uniref:Amine oxidase domain-containing protein n=1 Tax=Prymnesium parvum TaxID=97485 RepID=A0AB34JWU4_PRYPA